LKYLACLLLLSAGLFTATTYGCSPLPAAVTADGSKWVLGADGEPVKVGSWDHSDDGTPINLKGDTVGARKIAKPDPAQGIYQTGAFIGVISRLLILASVASLVASYWLPWLPKGAAWKGFAVAAGLIVGQYWLVAYGVVFAQVAFWVTLVAAVGAGLAVGWPWVVGWRNRQIIEQGKRLAASGDHRAGAALIIEGSPDTFTTTDKRKSLLTAVTLEAAK